MVMKPSEEAIKVEKAAVKCLSQRVYKTLVKLNIALHNLRLKDVKFAKRHLQNCKKFSLVDFIAVNSRCFEMKKHDN